MSDSVRPLRWQPTRIRRPWNSPGKNTGVGCHFLLQCMKVKSESSRSVMSDSSRPHGLQPTRLLCPWDFPSKSTGVGCHCLLQHKGLGVGNSTEVWSQRAGVKDFRQKKVNEDCVFEFITTVDHYDFIPLKISERTCTIPWKIVSPKDEC